MRAVPVVTATDRPLLLVGCGNMGRALLRGWAADWSGPIYVVEPQGLSEPVGATLKVVADAAALPDNLQPAAILLAVKPQVIGRVLPAYAGYAAAGALIISIAAGTAISTLAAGVSGGGGAARIVRIMPNTPAAIGQGIAAGFAGAGVDAADRQLVERLMRPAGPYYWVERESLIDAVTGVSGSGPAYVFLLAEAMAAAGRSLGLPDDLAAALARETVIGAGALMRANPMLSPEQLRQAVTSPGGTTRAALDVLMAAEGMETLLDKAIRAATQRAAELATPIS